MFLITTKIWCEIRDSRRGLTAFFWARTFYGRVQFVGFLLQKLMLENICRVIESSTSIYRQFTPHISDSIERKFIQSSWFTAFLISSFPFQTKNFHSERKKFKFPHLEIQYVFLQINYAITKIYRQNTSSSVRLCSSHTQKKKKLNFSSLVESFVLSRKRFSSERAPEKVISIFMFSVSGAFNVTRQIHELILYTIQQRQK